MELFTSSGFHRHVEELLHDRHIPGMAIAILHEGKMASRGFGDAQRSPRVPCTADTLFDIASASKSMTAAAVAVLVDNDTDHPDVQWGAKLSKLLPDDFVLPKKSYTEDVDVDDMVSHRTGMPAHDFSYLGIDSKTTDSAISVTRNLRNLALLAPIRTKYMYNNMMFTVATALVEKHTKKLFPDFLEDKFFGPLGMKSSNLQPARARAKGLGDRMSKGYTWIAKQQKYTECWSPDSPEAQGAGSIITSVNDYILWVKALMNQEGPITQGVYEGMIRSRTFPNPKYEDLLPFHSPDFYSAGLETFFYRGDMVVGHDGAILGFGTYHFFMPGLKFAGVLFGNSTDCGDVCKILTRELIDDAIKLPVSERLDWTKEIPIEEDKEAEEIEKQRQKLCPGIKESEPQTTPLTIYTGEYTNVGYHSVHVEIRDGKLYIDASDRSMAFTLSFEHVCGQTKYIAHLSDYPDGLGFPLPAEFEFRDDKPVRLGLELESDLEEYIWFDRV